MTEEVLTVVEARHLSASAGETMNEHTYQTLYQTEIGRSRLIEESFHIRFGANIAVMDVFRLVGSKGDGDNALRYQDKGLTHFW
jgi:hypothetical protein